MTEPITLKIWHGVKHDDATVTEIRTEDPMRLVKKLIREGGFWHDDAFIPWHKVNYIEWESGK